MCWAATLGLQNEVGDGITSLWNPSRLAQVDWGVEPSSSMIRSASSSGLAHGGPSSSAGVRLAPVPGRVPKPADAVPHTSKEEVSPMHLAVRSLPVLPFSGARMRKALKA